MMSIYQEHLTTALKAGHFEIAENIFSECGTFNLLKEIYIYRMLLWDAIDWKEIDRLYFLSRNAPKLFTLKCLSGRHALHHAIEQKSSFAIIAYLHCKDKMAISSFTTRGLLPLHTLLDCYNPSFIDKTVLKYLLKEDPSSVISSKIFDEEDMFDAAIDLPDRVTQTPYEFAVTRGYGDDIKRMMLLICPEANPKELKRINFDERKMALFVFYFANFSNDKSVSCIPRMLKMDGMNDLIRHIVMFL
jgi:hypothetical protein